jgi:hypothetical protein
MDIADHLCTGIILSFGGGEIIEQRISHHRFTAVAIITHRILKSVVEAVQPGDCIVLCSCRSQNTVVGETLSGQSVRDPLWTLTIDLAWRLTYLGDIDSAAYLLEQLNIVFDSRTARNKL